jgi:hypothetical protein
MNLVVSIAVAACAARIRRTSSSSPWNVPRRLFRTSNAPRIVPSDFSSGIASRLRVR